MSGWKPINTAPRDGRPILIWTKFRPWTGQPAWGQGQWSGSYWRLLTIVEGIDARSEDVTPQLWQPFPEPPTDEEKAQIP